MDFGLAKDNLRQKKDQTCKKSGHKNIVYE